MNQLAAQSKESHQRGSSASLWVASRGDQETGRRGPVVGLARAPLCRSWTDGPGPVTHVSPAAGRGLPPTRLCPPTLQPRQAPRHHCLGGRWLFSPSLASCLCLSVPRGRGQVMMPRSLCRRDAGVSSPASCSSVFSHLPRLGLHINQPQTISKPTVTPPQDKPVRQRPQSRLLCVC